MRESNMRISKNDYDEYQKLKEWKEKEEIRNSAKKITRLEDDIDLPIKKCVMALALLRCEPTFSCCGFDYDGQPFHKSHQYGEPYIRMKNNIYSVSLSTNPISKGWNFEMVYGVDVGLTWKAPANPSWRDPKCIHFSEEIVIAIQWLEDRLLKASDNFMVSAILKDTNHENRKSLKYWQYPPKEDWLIKKSDLL